MSKSISELCEILGVSPGATPKEIKRAYQELVLVWHPDRFEGKERLLRRAEEQMKLINEAYEVLRNGVPAEGAGEERYDNGYEDWEHDRRYEDYTGNGGIDYWAILAALVIFIVALMILPHIFGHNESVMVKPGGLFKRPVYEEVWKISWFWVILHSVPITVVTYLSVRWRDPEIFYNWGFWLFFALLITIP